MSCFYSVDSHDADFLTRLRDNNAVICGQIVAHALVRLSESPPNCNWKVALNYWAHGGNWIIEIGLLVAEAEWNDLRQHLEMQMKSSYGNKLQIQSSIVGFRN